MDFQAGFRVRALSIGDKVGVFGGDVEPATLDTSTWPVGSVYLQTNGTGWKKVGTDASAWVQLVSDEMLLLTIGMAVGRDGYARPMAMAGSDQNELMVFDNRGIALLQRILEEITKTNAYLSLISGEELHMGDVNVD